MALNPFFLQGSPGEQRLIQELINEHLKIYGIEIIYIPRKFVRKETILEEVSSSKFDDNFLLEAYLNTYDGYSGAGDILSKFGMSLRDELNLVISRERFEDFMIPLIEGTDGIEIFTRPREGDIIYFPLGQRLFEVKFVEHEKPFYQLGKNYVYELTCELFEYEDEIIDTSLDEVDTLVKDEGYITTLNLVGFGKTAIAESYIGTGFIKQIYLNDDGSGYTSPPTVTISPAPEGGINATARATIRQKGGIYSVDKIYLINSGVGYTTIPRITISGGGGIGAAATCAIETSLSGITSVRIVDPGAGYTKIPTVTFSTPIGIGETAVGISSISSSEIKAILLENCGIGYTEAPQVTIEDPPLLTGFGNYFFNEIVTGSVSQTKAIVKEWNATNNVLKVSFVDNNSEGFYPGEIIVGGISSARYSVQDYERMNLYDKYSQNFVLEQNSLSIIDFTESNPFGEI